MSHTYELHHLGKRVEGKSATLIVPLKLFTFLNSFAIECGARSRGKKEKEEKE